MFLTLTNVQTGDVFLQQPIDNRGGNLRIGLRSITFTVGWYNIESRQMVSFRNSDKGPTESTIIEPGLYSFSQLSEIIQRAGPGNTSLKVNETNGIISMETKQEVLLTHKLLQLLGLDDGLGRKWLGRNGIYIGDRPVNFSKTKVLCVHLEEINTTNNLVNGTRSTLLASIGLGCPSFGDVNTVYVNNPEYKQLKDGTLSELKVTIKDEFGKCIDNHQLPIYLTLEIL